MCLLQGAMPALQNSPVSSKIRSSDDGIVSCFIAAGLRQFTTLLHHLLKQSVMNSAAQMVFAACHSTTAPTSLAQK